MAKLSRSPAFCWVWPVGWLAMKVSFVQSSDWRLETWGAWWKPGPWGWRIDHWFTKLWAESRKTANGLVGWSLLTSAQIVRRRQRRQSATLLQQRWDGRLVRRLHTSKRTEMQRAELSCPPRWQLLWVLLLCIGAFAAQPELGVGRASVVTVSVLVG